MEDQDLLLQNIIVWNKQVFLTSFKYYPQIPMYSKLAFGLILVAGTITMFTHRTAILDLLRPLIFWMKSHLIESMFLYTFLFGCLITLLVPATLPILVSGWLFGFGLGTIISLLGCQICLLLVIGVGRKVFLS